MGIAQETKRIKRIFFFGVIPLILYGVAVVKFTAHQKAIEEQITQKASRIYRYYQNGFNVPNQTRIEEKSQEIKDARTKVDSIISYGNYRLKDFPADIQEPSVYFKEQLYLMQKELSQIASREGATLPETIGFDERLPQGEEVPELLVKLEMAKTVLKLLMENKANQIHLVEFLESGVMHGPEETPMPSRNLSLRIDWNGKPDSLAKVLYAIGNLTPFVIVEGLRIQRPQNEFLEVQFHLTQLLYAKGKA